ncbi:MAG TPA: FHA domain-containing protein [Cellulomonas sp.]
MVGQLVVVVLVGTAVVGWQVWVRSAGGRGVRPARSRPVGVPSGTFGAVAVRWAGRAAGRRPGGEVNRLIEMGASSALDARQVLPGGTVLMPTFLHLQVPHDLAAAVRMHLDHIAAAIEQRVLDQLAVLHLALLPGLQVVVCEQIAEGELAVVACFEQTAEPFPPQEATVLVPAGPAARTFTAGSAVGEPGPLGAGRPAAGAGRTSDAPAVGGLGGSGADGVRTPRWTSRVPRTPDPAAWRGMEMVLTVGGVAVSAPVGVAVRGNLVGRSPQADVVLPLRGGLSEEHCTIAACGPEEVEVTDLSQFGTSVHRDGAWRPLGRDRRARVPVPARFALGDAGNGGPDVVLEVRRPV